VKRSPISRMCGDTTAMPFTIVFPMSPKARPL
jgi:hypothetical protein